MSYNIWSGKKYYYLCTVNMNKNISTYLFSYQTLLESYLGFSEDYYKKTGKLKPKKIELDDNFLSLDLFNKSMEVLEVLKENKEALLAVEKATLEYVQLMVLTSPIIYVARTKDIKTDIEYFTAKTLWPLLGGKSKEIKIHLGKASNYNNDTKSEIAKKEAILKMRQTISRRIREGSL